MDFVTGPRYRTAVLGFLIALAICSRATAQDQLKTVSKQELAVIKVVLAQEAAWNRGDLDAFIQGYKDSPDTLFITHQIYRGYAGLLDEYRRDYPSKTAMGSLSFSELEVHALGDDHAVVVGKYHLDRGKKEGGPAEGFFTLTFENTEKGWKIIIDHTT
jgi:ketosteroid isomerase-like protein